MFGGCGCISEVSPGLIRNSRTPNSVIVKQHFVIFWSMMKNFVNSRVSCRVFNRFLDDPQPYLRTDVFGSVAVF